MPSEVKGKIPPPSPIIIGYTTKVRDPDTVRNFLGVRPPGTIKKPESIAAWHADPDKQAEAWAKIDALAPWTKLTGAINRVVAYDLGSNCFYDSRAATDLSPGAGFVAWMFTRYVFPARLHSDRYPVVYYGFNPKPLLRISGQEAIRGGLMHPPVSFWYSANDNHVLDPKEMLLESEVKNYYPVAKICAEAPGGAIPYPGGYRQHQDAMIDFRLAVELCCHYKLLPVANDSALRKIVTIHPEWSLSPPAAEEEGEEPEETEESPEDEPEKKVVVKKKSSAPLVVKKTPGKKKKKRPPMPQ